MIRIAKLSPWGGSAQIPTGISIKPKAATCLDAGADDYLTRPFGFDELLARVRARLRVNDERDRLAKIVDDLQQQSNSK